MPVLSRLSTLCRNLLRNHRLEKDLDDEVRAYVEMLTADKVRAGSDRDRAQREALIEAGGVEQVKEQVREIRTGFSLQTLLQDIRYGVRTLLRNPGFALVALLALAIGIGANTAIFSVVYGVLFRPLPYRDANHVAMIYVHFLPQNTDHGTMSMADYLDWRAQNHVFEEPALLQSSGFRFDLTGSGRPEQVPGTSVTAGFFSVLQATPLLGRVFHAGDDSATSTPRVVLSESLWRRHFGADPNVIGKAVQVNGIQRMIIGVMPATFRFPPQCELWTNLRLIPPTRRGPFPYLGIGRLKSGVSFEQAQAETNRIGRQIEEAHPTGYRHLSFPVVPLREALVGNSRSALLIMFGAVIFVLLIATVNVANLTLARATTRQREMVLRMSLGAGRARLLQQLLTESVLLALLGGLLGLALASTGEHFLRVWNPGNLPRIEDVHLDGRVLCFTFLVAAFTGVLFGLAPALEGTRADLNTTMKESGRSGTATSASQRTRNLLVVSEIALSFVLVVAAGLMLRSFALLQNVDAGFEASPRNVLSAEISPSAIKYTDEKAGIQFYQRLLERVRGLPGVEAAGLSDGLPPDRQADYDTFQIEGEPWTEEGFPAIAVARTSFGYFQSLGIPLRKGRYFTERDKPDSPLVAIISESLARQYFGIREPVGRHMKASGPYPGNPWLEIVGVVGDVKYKGLEGGSAPAYYLPDMQDYQQRMYLVVRSRIAPEIGPWVRREVAALDSDVTVNKIETLEEGITASVAQPRFRTLLIAAFAGVAVLLATIGIYGVIAYGVTQRTNEIGIRMALGAKRSDVLGMIMGQGAILALAGVGIGILGALAITRTLARLLFGVSATDLGTFAAVSLLLVSVALLAALVPAYRVTRIDPLVALRYE